MAEEQPSTQAAEHVAAPPVPEAPVEAEVSDMDALFSSSQAEFLQAVCILQLPSMSRHKHRDSLGNALA